MNNWISWYCHLYRFNGFWISKKITDRADFSTFFEWKLFFLITYVYLLHHWVTWWPLLGPYFLKRYPFRFTDIKSFVILIRCYIGFSYFFHLIPRKRGRRFVCRPFDQLVIVVSLTIVLADFMSPFPAVLKPHRSERIFCMVRKVT